MIQSKKKKKIDAHQEMTQRKEHCFVASHPDGQRRANGEALQEMRGGVEKRLVRIGTPPPPAGVRDQRSMPPESLDSPDGGTVCPGQP